MTIAYILFVALHRRPRVARFYSKNSHRAFLFLSTHYIYYIHTIFIFDARPPLIYLYFFLFFLFLLEYSRNFNTRPFYGSGGFRKYVFSLGFNKITNERKKKKRVQIKIDVHLTMFSRSIRTSNYGRIVVFNANIEGIFINYRSRGKTRFYVVPSTTNLFVPLVKTRSIYIYIYIFTIVRL